MELFILLLKVRIGILDARKIKQHGRYHIVA